MATLIPEIMAMMAGGIMGGFITSLFLRWTTLRPLQNILNRQAKQLKDAHADVEIVRALRSGDLNPADLREIDLTPPTSDWNLPKLTRGYSTLDVVSAELAKARLAKNAELAKARLAKNITAARAALQARAEKPAGPRFVPNLYKRAPFASSLAPGDDVWVAADVIYASASNGRPVLLKQAKTVAYSSFTSPLRIRVYEDGSLSLSVPHGVVIASKTTSEPTIPIARIVNLATGETQELSGPLTSRDFPC